MSERYPPEFRAQVVALYRDGVSAKKYEEYEPGERDQVAVEEYLLQRAALTRARSEREVVDAVAPARLAGIPRSKIGEFLGTSAQAAQQRYGTAVEQTWKRTLHGQRNRPLRDADMSRRRGPWPLPPVGHCESWLGSMTKRGYKMPRMSRAFGLLVLFASLVFISCSDDGVEVTGSTGRCIESNTEWIGDPPADVAVPGEVLTRTITCPERTMSDSRLDGETVIDIRCEFSNQDGQTVGVCVKDATTTNEGGTWVEEGGSLQIIVGTPSQVVEEENVEIGTGEYEGLQFVYTTGGSEYPWPITGTLETTE